MAVYRVQGPDGNIYRIEGPDDASEQEIQAAAAQSLGGVSAQEEPKPETGFIPSIKRGAMQVGALTGDILPAMGARFVEGLARPEDREAVQNYAEQQFKEYQQTQEEIQKKYPVKVESITDVKGIGDLIDYAVEAVGEAIPSMIPAVLTGGTTAVLTRAIGTQAAELAFNQAIRKGLTTEVAEAAAMEAAKKATQKYTTAGLLAGSSTQTVPEAYASIKEATGTEDMGAALVSGFFNAALDSILPASLISRARAAGIPEEAIIGAWYKRGGKGALKGFVTEGGTEALQEASNAAAESFVDNNIDFFSEKNFERFLNAGIKGGIGGGAISGAADIALGRAAPEQPEVVPPTAPTTPEQPQVAGALGYSPLAGTPTVFPDGTVALGSEAELARRYEEQPTAEGVPVQQDMFPTELSNAESRQRFEERWARAGKDLAEQEAAPTEPTEPQFPTVLSADVLANTGLKPQSAFFKRLVDKDVSDPKQAVEVADILQQVRENRNLSDSTKAAIETVANTAYGAMATQGELFGKRSGKVSREGRGTEAPVQTQPQAQAELPLEEAPAEQVITEETLKDLKVSPKNKTARSKLLGKELSDPVVRQALEDVANAPTSGTLMREAIGELLDTLPEAPSEPTRTEPSGRVGGVEPGRPRGGVAVPSSQLPTTPAVVAPEAEGLAGLGAGAQRGAGREGKAQPAVAKQVGKELRKLTQAQEEATMNYMQAAKMDRNKALEYLAGDIYNFSEFNKESGKVTKIKYGKPGAMGVKGIGGRFGKAFYESLPTAERSKVMDEVAKLRELERKSDETLKEINAQQKAAREPKYRTVPQDNPISGVKKEQVQNSVDKIVAGWANLPPVKVVQSFEDLPDNIQDDANRQNVNVQGAFNPGDGKVYIVADNIFSNKEIVEVIAHEITGHFGLRSILGDTYADVMQKIYNGNRKVRDAAKQMMEDEGLDQNTATEEVLADMAETGAEPEVINKLVKLIKQFLSKIRGIRRFVDQFSDNDVKELVANARQYVIYGRGVAAKGKVETGAVLRAQPKTASQQAANTDVDSFMQGMGNIVNKKAATPEPTLIGKITAFALDPAYRKEAINNLRTQVVYKGASAEEKLKSKYNNAIRDSLGDIRPDVLMLQSEHSDNVAAAVTLNGKLVLDPKTGLWKAEKGSASLSKVFEQISALGQKLGDVNKAYEFASQVFIGVRAKELKKRNADLEAKAKAAEAKGNNQAATLLRDQIVSGLPSDQQIAAAEAAFNKYAELRTAFQQFTEFKNGLVDSMVEAGRLSKEQAQSWKDAAGYVPWNRIKEAEDQIQNSPKMFFKGLTNLGSIKKIKGGSEEINNVFDNMVGLSFWMVNSAIRNHAGVKMADALSQIDAREVKSTTPDVDESRLVYVYKDGVPTVYELGSVADMYAFKGVESIGGPFLKAFSSLANTLRKGTTAMPGFALSQLFQDSYRAMLLSGAKNPWAVPGKVLKNFAEEIKPILGKKPDSLSEMLSSYGIIGAYDVMPGRAREEIERKLGMKRDNVLHKAFSTLEAFSLASDAAQRRAVYEQTMKETGDPALALYRAQEIINFKRQGANRTVGVLRQIIPFFNAYLQGMDILYRTLQGTGISTEERAMAQRLFFGTALKLMALSTLYAMLVGGDDEYEKLRGYERDKFFIIPGTGLKIPVPAEIGMFTKVIPERVYHYVMSQGTDRPDDAKETMKAIGTGLLDAFTGPSLTPQAVKPILEVATNYSFFTGTPIVGRGLEKVETTKQFTESTSEISKTIGGLLNLSPMKIDHLIKGYTGIAGGTVLAMTDVAVGNKPGRSLYQLPQFRTFMYNQQGGGMKEDFYKFRADVEEATATISLLKNQGRIEELKEYLGDKENLMRYGMRSVVSKIDDKLSELRKYRNIVVADPKLTSSQKKEIVERIQKVEDAILKGYNVPRLREITKQ